MIKVQILAVGEFRDMFGERRFIAEIPTDEDSIPLGQLIEFLDRSVNGQLSEKLFLPDGTRDDWVRTMLNGWDVRFLSDDKLIVKDGDNVIFSTVLAGG